MSTEALERLGIPCMQLRGGSSKGAFFVAGDLPDDTALRDDLVLRVMGSPDPRQVDGIGGAHPLTTKVAIVSPSDHPDADVDYLFLQLQPEGGTVSTAQTCGNLLAAVAPFALERGMLATTTPTTVVRIRMLNPDEAFAISTVQTPDGHPRYDGATLTPGVPFPAAPVHLAFPGPDRPVFPTGRLVDHLAGLDVTCVDGGMPVVVVRAADLTLVGDEPPSVLEDDDALTERIQRLRLAAGQAMGLGDVMTQSVPKISLVSEPRHGGTVMTRTFIPYRVHPAIGVLGGVSVAVAVRTAGTVASRSPSSGDDPLARIEHPTGTFDVGIELTGAGATTRLHHSTVVRTARKLADGRVWPRAGRRD